MEIGSEHPRALSDDIAKLRQEFDAAARSSRNMGTEAKTALSAIRVESDRASNGSKGLGRALTSAFGDVIEGGKSFQDILRSLAADLAKLAVENVFSGAGQAGGFDLGGLFGGLISVNGQGNAFNNGRLTTFAKGGILSNPALFPMAGGVGLAGEAGPEAIIPLSRGSDGKLGVSAQGNVRPVAITFNVTATDAASFQRSETQVAAMLNRAVSRGARNL